MTGDYVSLALPDLSHRRRTRSTGENHPREILSLRRISRDNFVSWGFEVRHSEFGMTYTGTNSGQLLLNYTALRSFSNTPVESLRVRAEEEIKKYSRNHQLLRKNLLRRINLLGALKEQSEKTARCATILKGGISSRADKRE